MNTLDLFKAIIAYIKNHTMVSFYIITMTVFISLYILGLGKVSFFSINFQMKYLLIQQIIWCFGLFTILALDRKKGLADKENQNDLRELEEDLE